VEDEESVQTKSWMFLFDICRVRGLLEAAFLRNQTAEWFEDIAENIAIDRGEPVQADSVPDSFEVRNKVWFSMNRAFRCLASEWTVQDNDESKPNDDDEPEGDDDSDEEPQPAEIHTKAQLFKAYSGRGPTRMFCDLIADRRLQQHAILITSVAQPLEKFYHDSLEAQKANSRLFAATRSAGGVLMKAHNARLFRQMGLSPRFGNVPAGNEPWVQEEVEMVKLVWTFASHLASNISWSQLQHKYSLPHAVAVLAHPSPEVRRSGMDLLKRMTLAIRKAMEKSSTHGYLTDVLRDVGWHEQVLPTEIMIMMWQTGFDAENAQLLHLAAQLYSGSCTTKDVLESTFAHLKDTTERSAKNKKASPHSMWTYAQASKYAATGGLSPIRPSEADWAAEDKQEPSSIPRNAGAVQKVRWRNAGPLAHQKSVAAMALLMSDSENEFQHVQLAWAGAARPTETIEYILLDSHV
ncbi:unnamed protein product, partial [Effrenium voratum]